ncbi:helix-turn-helix domain-containing protein [Mesorhizobium sp. M7A.F.Ca.MR.176.00.0.0]|uniref:GlxA family transcriptional regulator n=1 Tax=unclassified Mesorhizobium TaxID=325217 RepID=UPI0013E334DD|nr:helix-turn-helix domain-containing protein [Mesorhizobium sp. M7A.F.Ca.MR.176.00.0.0]
MDKWTTNQKLKIFVAEGFPTLAYSAIVAGLSAVNKVLDSEAYTWDVVSSEGGVITSDALQHVMTNRATTSEGRRSDARPANFIVLVSEITQPDVRQWLTAWIREGLARGTKVIAVGRATMLLAEAGFLCGRRCAVHWRDFGVAVERFPRVLFARTLYEIDGPFHTCAGEMSALDLILRIVESNFGRTTAEWVAGETLYGSLRCSTDRQKPPMHIKLERLGSPILKVVDLMESNLANPIGINELVETSPISRRQVERLFEREMGMSPQKFYLRLRLERALELLRYSAMPIIDVAVATGFISPSHFSKAFRTAFGISPTDCRRVDHPSGTSTDAQCAFRRLIER